MSVIPARFAILAALGLLLVVAQPAAALVEIECSAASGSDATGQASYDSQCSINDTAFAMPAPSAMFTLAEHGHDAMLASGACSSDGTCMDNDVIVASYAKNETGGGRKVYIGHVTLLK